MNTSTTFILAVAMVCAVCTAVRLPAALRGEKLPIFWAFALTTVFVFLLAPPVYEWVDWVLGGQDYAHLVYRISLYTAFLQLGIAYSKAFDSMLVLWLVGGRSGVIKFSIVTAVTVASHILCGTSSEENYYDTPAGYIYFWVCQIYIAYVAICLLAAILPAALTPSDDRIYRWSAALLSLGFLSVANYPVVNLINPCAIEKPEVFYALEMITVLLIVSGSMLAWIAPRVRRLRRLQTQNA